MNATLSFINGNIITMKDKVIKEAVAVENDKIIGVGSSEQIMALSNKMTHFIDLKGKTLLPGFIDTHMHLLGFGFSFESINLFNTQSYAELVEKCKKHIQDNNLPDGSWVLGRGFNQNEFVDKKEYPTTKVIDSISAKHPILLLSTDGHIGITNNLALRLAKVDENTFIRGGSFDKYENGKPNGVIREASLEWFKKQISRFRGTEDLKRAMQVGGKALSEFGITSIHTEDSYDLGYSGNLDDVHEAYRKLIIENQMPLRIYQKVSLPRKKDLLDFLNKPLRTGQGNDFFRMGPMKLWTDGTLGARTAALLEEYVDEPGQKGIYLYDDDELKEMMKTAHDNDMQLCLHCIGDGALEQVIHCFEDFIKSGVNKLRHRIVHCQVGHHEQYKRIARLGITINIQPVQTATDFPMIEHRLGKNRASTCHAWRTCIDCGINVTGSSDVPCSYSLDAANVFYGIHAIVNREQWLQDEAVEVYDALKMYTVNAAVSAFEEDVKGTVEVGKFADLVVVDKNPLTIDKKDLKNIGVDMTFLSGKLVCKTR